MNGWMHASMRGWLDACVDSVLRLWRGLISSKLGLFVVLCCHCIVCL